MSTRVSHSARILAGGLLLAFWLGWVAVALAHLQPSWRSGDPRQAERALEAILARLPADAGSGPLAIRLQTGCACDDGSDRAWQALAAGLHDGGGRAIALDHAGAFEVLILAADRRPVYAGPLVPDPALCGGGDAGSRLRRWLPQLLEHAGTPLVSTTACSC